LNIMSVIVVLLIVGALVWLLADRAGEPLGGKIAELGRICFFVALLTLLMK
jgi:VIT1/CCC1 family predicted Fe2+/Mn2+ transporter